MTNETQPAPTTGHGSTLGERGQRALEAAAAGLYVFPLYPGTKNMPAVKDWENEATRDPEKIMQWWAKRPYNLAIATLPSRLVVVDLDPAKPGAPELAEPYEGCKHGLQVFQRMADAAGEKFPLDTYRVQSPRKGVHLYFRAPDDVELRNSESRLAPLLDVRAGGGYIVAATSRRSDGVYRAQNSRPIAPLPRWLLDAMCAARPAPQPEPIPVPRAAHAGTSATRGKRVQAYVDRIVEAELDKLKTVPKGVGRRHKARRDAALKVGNLVGGEHLTRADALARLLEVALTHVGTTTDSAGRVRSITTAQEVTTTIENGLDYGMKRPRVITEAELQDRR
ncbi:hypothetical protein DMP15_29780 [Pseudonocardia sp. UM4_GMWB1]|uniref:bifunctional DNA primase/polymerase n=1 Tax=Pseudonocardia sp. UM4_GMWB1 TaxID=2212989 RepID=UPI00307F4FB5